MFHLFIFKRRPLQGTAGSMKPKTKNSKPNRMMMMMMMMMMINKKMIILMVIVFIQMMMMMMMMMIQMMMMELIRIMMMIIMIIIDIRTGNIFMMNNLKDVNIVMRTMLMLMIFSKAN